jgi:hypothetical protein
MEHPACQEWVLEYSACQEWVTEYSACQEWVTEYSACQEWVLEYLDKLTKTNHSERKQLRNNTRKMSTQCEGKTKSNVRCKNKTRNVTKRCHLHAELVPTEGIGKTGKTEGKKELPEQSSGNLKIECCVCMEEMPTSDNLECGHPVCRSCLSQLRNDKCPMCRRDIKAKHIKPNDKKKMRDRFRDDRISRQNQAIQQFLIQAAPAYIRFVAL